MESYRRQERKKELSKQKKARIAARDEHVKEHKTIAEINTAMANLERRKNKNHGETMKLQRLQKELKLVKEATKNRPKKASLQPKKPLTELDDPRKSVYYDERMNPFGAPPPGRPRLYHRRGGGTTMDVKEAIVPGLEEEKLRQQQAEQPQYIQEYGKDGTAIISDAPKLVPSEIPQQQKVPPPPPPPPPQQQKQQQTIPPPPPPPPLPTEPAPPASIIPKEPPSLPNPSSSVARTGKRKKRKLAADIWASTEEVEYERVHSGIDLEQADAAKAAINWYYYDNYNVLQGPFTAVQMEEWKGYFRPHTLVRRGPKGKFVPMSSIPSFLVPSEDNDTASSVAVESNPRVNNHRRKEKKQQQEQYQQQEGKEMDGIASQQEGGNDDDDDDSVQARIERLRQLEQREEKEGREEDNDDDDSVQARINALRGDNTAAKEGEDERKDNTNNTIQSRIDSLRQQHQQANDDENDDDTDSVQARTQALRDDNDSSTKDDNKTDNDEDIQARIEALRRDTTKATHSNEVPPGPIMGNIPAYPVLDNDEPPAYPIMDNDDPPAYPTMDNDEPPAYPIGDDAAYPVDEYENAASAAYPMDDGIAYPTDVSYPVTDAYPIDDDDDGGGDQTAAAAYPLPPPVIPDDVIPGNDASQEKKKKVVKIDKAIVGFLPSHLQKKRKLKT